MSKIEEKIEKYLGEAKIDWQSVRDAGKNVAEDIHGEADMDAIDNMIEKMKEENWAKDTEDAIQIIINMLRS